MNTNDPLNAPDCMQEKTKLIIGRCPLCGKELEFFSIPELSRRYCYNCKKPFDVTRLLPTSST
jgi:predicted amidophosphoribosyltransferase